MYVHLPKGQKQPLTLMTICKQFLQLFTFFIVTYHHSKSILMMGVANNEQTHHEYLHVEED